MRPITDRDVAVYGITFSAGLGSLASLAFIITGVLVACYDFNLI
jgi:hypothetical protein